MVLFGFALILIAAILQYYMGRIALRSLSCELACEAALVEPDEEFSLQLIFRNRSRLPILYLQASLQLPAESQCPETFRLPVSDYLDRKHCVFTGWLLPRHALTIEIPVSLPRRGSYTFGGVALAAGDLLGLSEEQTALPLHHRVCVKPIPLEIIPRHDNPGGLLGDISVRRWIHEDPILTAGFREYTGREPQRSIAWTKSLSSGRLMVRNYDHTAEPRSHVMMLIDGTAEESVLERWYSLTRSVCEELDRMHVPFSFRTNGELPSFLGMLTSLEPGLGVRHLEQILEGLARATGRIRQDAAEAIRQELRRRRYDRGYLWIVPEKTARLTRLAAEFSDRTGCEVRILEPGEGGAL